MSETVIDITRFSTLEYVFECLSALNAGCDKLILRACSGTLSKGVEIAQILQAETGATIQKITLDSLSINNIKVPFIEIPLKPGHYSSDRIELKEKEKPGDKFATVDFINYSTYHLLFDWYLKQSGSLKIFARGQKKKPVLLLEIKEENGIRKYKAFRAEELEEKEEIQFGEVNNALFRSGLLFPAKWNRIGTILSKFDDIILGLDTNILFNCSMTRHILPLLSLIEARDFLHTPNWILLIIPSTVMYELEEAANIRDEKGYLRFKGRMGFRSLQEVLDLSENIDIPGISLLIHGETNPVIDIKNALVGIRKDMGKYFWSLNGVSARSYSFKKSSSGDMSIRTQFKKFLNQIDFHKGTFFLTTDKSNSALAQAEGLSPIYIPYSSASPVSDLSDNSDFFTSIKIPDKPDEKGIQLTLNVPLGNIIYEMAVSFGEIIVSCGDHSPSIECHRKGDDIGRWVHKQLLISKNDLGALFQDYTGKYKLKTADQLNQKLISRFENVNWLSDTDGAFKI